MIPIKVYIAILAILLNAVGYSQPNGLFSIEDRLSVTERWNPLEENLKGARIVALGENLHGVEEYNAVKLELIKHLHEELGFDVIAIESDVATNFLGNLYRESIPDTTLLKELFWPPWHTEEYLQLVRYLKAHQELKIIGLDVGTKKPLDAIADVLEVEIDYADPAIASFQVAYANWDEVNGANRKATVGKRDSTMAQVLSWVANELYPDDKIIIAAHNSHISKVQVGKACMGELLAHEYGSGYFSIGLFHSTGDPKNVLRYITYENEASALPESSIQYQLLKLSDKDFYLDIQAQKGNKQRSWLFEELDNVLLIDKHQSRLNLGKSFDAVIWFKRVTHPDYIIENKYLERRK